MSMKYSGSDYCVSNHKDYPFVFLVLLASIAYEFLQTTVQMITLIPDESVPQTIRIYSLDLNKVYSFPKNVMGY